MKRLVDVLISLAALAVLSPLLLLAAVAVWTNSGLPILFRHVRIGRDGREFNMYKFRSMVVNADRVGPWHTAENDPRITRVGKILRRTSIDELPQILNVLLGDMSLVGPRPDVPAQRGLYSDAQWQQRCSVRPGITGLAQVLYRSECTHAQRTEADLRYVRERSLLMDLRIMASTLTRLSGKASN